MSETLNPCVVQPGRSPTLKPLAALAARPAPVPERTKGVACKAMIHGFKSRPALQRLLPPNSVGRATCR